MELTQRTAGVQITSMDDLTRVAEMMANSGFFADAREAAQAGVKIMAGQAWGIDPFNAMTGIHIIKNRPTISAGLMAAAVKASGKYDFRVRQIDGKVCKIEFFQRNESIGVSEFTIEDAKKAGTQNLDKFARNMLYARSMSNGVRWYCPDVFTSSVYTAEELGAVVNEDGEILDAQTVSITPEPEYEEPHTASEDATEDVEFPPEPPEGTLDGEDADPALITANQLKLLAMKLKKAGFKTDDDGKEQGRAFLAHLVGADDLAFAKDLTKHQASKALDVLTDDDATNEAVAKWTDELALEEVAA